MSKTTWYFERPPFSEIDAGGVLYHAHYLSVADRARHAWLDALGYPFRKIWDQKLAPAVVHVESDYKRAVSLGQNVVVRTELTGWSGVRLEFQQRFFAPQANWQAPLFKAGSVSRVVDESALGPEVFHLKITLVCVNVAQMKATRWPDEFTALLE